MCEPTTIAMATFALSAATTASGVYAQRQQANAQEAANKQQYENSMIAYRGNLANIEATRAQLQQDATEQVNLNNRAARKATATAYTSAGENSVAGNSVDALLRNLAGMAGTDNANAETNYLRQDAALNVKRENMWNSTSSEINSLKTPTMPDYLGAAFQLGSSGLSAYSSYKKQQQTLKGGL